MAGHGKGQKRLDALGVHLVRPVDRLPERRLADARNMRSYLDDILEVRKGHSVHSNDGVVIAGKSPLHSIRRLSDQSAGTSALIMGVGDRLAVESGNLPAINADGAYSGNPLSLIPFRPQEAVEPWMLVSDGARMRKARIDATVHQIGLPAPTTPPTAEQTTQPYRREVRRINAVDWADAGPGTLALGPTVVTPVSISDPSGGITTVLSDDGTGTGWACIIPDNMTNIVKDGFIIVNDGGVPGPATQETTVMVHEVHPGSPTTTAIAAIVYDVGSTGLCTIQLSADIVEIERNSVIKINAAGLVRVLSIVRGRDGRTCIRANTGAVTYSQGQSVQAVPSFRTYWAFRGAITSKGASITTAGTAGEFSIASTGLSLDLSKFILPDNAVASKPADYMTILVWLDRPDRVVEGKIILDVNGGVVAERYKSNYYMRAWRPSDLTPLLEGQQTAVTTRREQRLRRMEQIPIMMQPDSGDYTFREEIPPLPPASDPDTGAESPSTEGGSGRSQWFALTFQYADLVKVGSDDAKTLKSVEAVKLTLTTQENGGNSTVEARFSMWFVWGGFEPDSEKALAPYIYRYRGRSSITGARSNFSPPSLGIYPRREKVLVTLTQHPSSECDKLDIERWGGSIFGGANDGWRLIGTVDNSAAPEFVDTISDNAADANLHSSDGNTNAQPFTVTGAPLSGTLIRAAGTALEDSAGSFPITLAQGTQIIVGGIPATVYRVSSDGSRLHTYESVGALGAVGWEIPAPRYVGQPLVIIGDETTGIFGLADSRNPGRLYFLNRGQESTRERNYLDVTSPSEPLMNGAIWNDRVYVFSTERCFQINEAFEQSPDGEIIQQYSKTEVSGVPGLYARWAIATGKRGIFFLGSPGEAIFLMTGSEAVNLTDLDLRPIFPRDGDLGATVRSVRAPQITSANEAGLRLGIGGGYLWFDYPDSGGTYRTLAYCLEQDREGWWYDEIAFGARIHHGEEGRGRQMTLVGGSDGKLYRVGGLSNDNAAAVPWNWQSVSEDFGDPRTEKVMSDAAVGLESGGEVMTLTLGYDKHSRTDAGTSVSDATTKPVIIDINAGDGENALNISIAAAGSVATNEAPKFHWWEPSYINRPEDVVKRATDNEHLGRLLPKHLQGVTILADTENAIKTVQVLGDNDLLIATLTVQHDGPQTTSFTWEPAITKVARLRPTDANRWKPIEIEWHYAPEPEIAKVWKGQPQAFGTPGWKHAKELWVMYASAQTVGVVLSLDGTDHVYSLPSTGGTSTRRKTRIMLNPAIFKLLQPALSELVGAGCRVYLNDCELHVKEWGSNGPYRIEKPFGDMHAQPSAVI